MRWSFTVFRVAGTDVKIHVTFFLLLAWIGFAAWHEGGPAAAADSLIFIVLLFACVVLHEFGHILVARRYGIATPEVTLLPIGGVASLKSLPTKPLQELAVAIAGPLVNVAIALLIILALGEVRPEAIEHLDDQHVSLLVRLAAANLFLAIFNLIPAFPMDGGRVLHALLSLRYGPARATQIAANVGQALAFVFGFLGLFGNPLLIFVAIFVYVAAAGEAQVSALQESAKGLKVGDATETKIATLSANATLGQAVDALIANAQHEFPVVDAFNKPMGLFTREDILAALKANERDKPIVDLLRAPPATAFATSPLAPTLEKIFGESASALCVTDADGVLVGLLTRQNLAEVMMIRTARPDWRFGAKSA